MDIDYIKLDLQAKGFPRITIDSKLWYRLVLLEPSESQFRLMMDWNREQSIHCIASRRCDNELHKVYTDFWFTDESDLLAFKLRWIE